MTTDGIKKGKPSKIKATAKFLFDVPAWIGTDNIKQSTSWLSQLIQRTFRVRHPSTLGQQETFADAMKRMGVSAEDLPGRAKRFLWLSLMFLILSIGSLFYLAYLWSRSSWIVVLAAFVVFCLFSVRSYFYGLWYFQIKQKRLDCSFKEWLIWLFKGEL